MVSPCKRRKTERRGREEAPPRSAPGNRKAGKPLKPLSDKKFYLDIKNHVSLKRIEEKLKSLGASLELFLVRGVDCVVTDRADFPRPSPAASVSPATQDSPAHGLTPKRTRSRAEAMLDRLKQQPQKVSGDVLDNAISWRIPIYTLQRFVEWVERVGRRGGLKLEVPRSRPDLRLFTTWPRPPFSSHQPTTRMTRKVGRPPKDVSSGAAAGGYCEVCRVHYNDLEEHVSSNGHVKLVTDPAQYSHLDSIIAQHSLGGGSRKSLRIAKSPPMGGRQSSEAAGPLLNGHATRSARQQLPQPVCNGLVGSKGSSGGGGESEGGGHNLRSTPGRRGRVSRKRLSAEEKLIEDNKAYYKVEVLNSKLRSTGYMISQRAVEEAASKGEEAAVGGGRVNGEKTAKEAEPAAPPAAPPVVVRFKKVRRSQLAVLSDEAESFMFGERKSSDEEEEERKDESKRRRRTHAEAFIHDNLDYYKFEMAGSRLRSAGADNEPNEKLQQVPPPPPPPEKPLKVETEDYEDMKAESLEFGFERWCTGQREGWRDTWSRLEKGEEFYLQRHHAYPRVELPPPPPPTRRPGPGAPPGPRKHKSHLHLDDKPRKSPRRCHASTLAILSSLGRRRGGSRGADPVVYTEEESLPETVYSSCSGGGGLTTEESTCSPHHAAAPAPTTGWSRGWAAAGGDRIADCLRAGTHSWQHGPCLDIDPQVLADHRHVPGIGPLESGPKIELDELVRTIPESWPSVPFPSLASFLFWPNEGSCDGSDCSDILGFSEDGRVVSGRRKRKRKKRNLTGWPLEKIKKKCVTPSSPATTTLLTLDGVMEVPVKRKVGRPPKKHKLISSLPPSSPPPPPSSMFSSSSPFKRKSRL